MPWQLRIPETLSLEELTKLVAQMLGDGNIISDEQMKTLPTTPSAFLVTYFVEVPEVAKVEE